MRNQILSGILTVTTLLAGAVSCATADPRRPTGHDLRAEKQGRVVDSETGVGISDAKIIAVWKQHSSGVSGMVSAGTWCNLQKIVTTDDEGRFVLPDTSHELEERETHFGRLSLNELWSDWLLIVFKPGYVRAGDLEILPTHERHLFLWQVEPPEMFDMPLGRVGIRPVAMKKVVLDAPSLWIYFSAVLTSARCNDSHGTRLTDSELGDITNAVATAVRPMPCALPPSTSIAPTSFSAFAGLSHPNGFDVKFFERVKSLNGLPTSERFDPLDKVTTTAGALCQAVTEEGALR